jgi:hypothetical protein
VLSGTPTTTGTSNFTVTATDTIGATGTQSYGLAVAAASMITLSPSSLPGATVGTAYSQTITATGGASPYTFTVTSGSLPDGLTLSTAGVLSGIPTTTGTANFTVTATDTNNATGSQSYGLVVHRRRGPR